MKKSIKKNIAPITAGVVALGLAIGGVYFWQKGHSGTGQNVPQNATVVEGEQDQKASIKDEYDYYGTLSAVDGSQTTGEAGFSFTDGNFLMAAQFEDLVDPQDGYFYEGWLVNPSNGEFISTGELSLATGAWMNTFSSNQDYTAYTKYVLTLEPRDDNPDPADHVAEGILSLQKKDESASTNQTESKNGYVSLSEYNANKAAYDSGGVVYFFNARWCPTCKVLDGSLKQQAGEFPSDLTVVDVDYDSDEAKALKDKYQVTVQHTLVQVTPDGEQVAKWTGGGDLQSVQAELQ